MKKEELGLKPEDNLHFKYVQEVYDKIFKEFRIIVTTCGTASDARLLTSRRFSRILIDEATMVKEIDSLVPTKNG